MILLSAGSDAKLLPNDPAWRNVVSSVGKGLNFDLSKEMSKAISAGADRVLYSLLNRSVNDIVKVSGFGREPLWESREFFSPLGSLEEKASKENILFASLSGLNLIDVERVSWEQIVAFRSDSEARAALRDLRLFFSAEFEPNDDPAYIQDRLASLVHSYEVTVRSWGFATATKTLDVAFSKASLFSTAFGAMSAALFGAPLPVAVGASAVAALGPCAVEVGKAVLERRTKRFSNPVRYLTDLKSRLTK